MKYRDVDPKIKALFPWALFLVLALVLAFAATKVHAEEDLWACYGSGRYQAMSSAWPPCNEMCGKLKAYMQMHTEAEARAKAVEMKLPRWVIRKAERCL